MPEIKELETLETAVKGYKTETDKEIGLIKSQLKTQADENEVLKKAAEAWEAKFTASEDKIKTVNAYAENIEKQLKAKQLTPQEQISFVNLLGKAVEEKWDEISKYKENQGGKKLKIYITATKAAADMGITTNVADAGAYFTTVQIGIRALPNRKVHMRELIPLGTMSTSSLTYMREEFKEYTVPAEYIAGWLRVSRKMLDDMAAFRSYLQMRLLEMYLKAEDNQVLLGNGTSPQLTGLLTVAVAATNTTGPNIERLVRAIAQLEASDYTATGIILHPSAYFEIALNKAVGSGEYDLPTALVIIQNGQMYIAGVPVYKTTAIATTKYLVGDWMMGAQLFIREQPVIEFFDQDANNVTTNKITVRIEGRVALAIYRAEAFVQGTLAVPQTT